MLVLGLFTKHVYMSQNMNLLLATPVSLALAVIGPLALWRGARLHAARALAVFTVVLAVAALLLRLVPALSPDSGALLALALPVHTSIAIVLWRWKPLDKGATASTATATAAHVSLSVGIDVGGTFTDLASVEPDGAIEAAQGASTPADQSEGVAARRSLRSAPAPASVSRVAHGTTVVTNLLLERRGARVALCATAGATDLLELRRQDRAALYDLSQDHPPPLVGRGDVVAVHERRTPRGVTVALTDEEAERVAGPSPRSRRTSSSYRCCTRTRTTSTSVVLPPRSPVACPGSTWCAAPRSFPRFANTNARRLPSPRGTRVRACRATSPICHRASATTAIRRRT